MTSDDRSSTPSGAAAPPTLAAELALVIKRAAAIEANVAVQAETLRQVLERLKRLEHAVMCGDTAPAAKASDKPCPSPEKALPSVRPAPEPRESEPPWLLAMRSHLGVREIPGKQHHPWIQQALATVGLRDAPDETAWCSAALAQVMAECGISLVASTPQGRVTAAARSWLLWGRPLTEPRLGCVVVLSRTDNPAHGHVGLYTGEKDGRILLLGGNQSNRLSLAAYDRGRVLGWRWPA